jgi:hypothetical protein
MGPFFFWTHMSVGRAGQRLGRPLAEASHGTRGVTTRGLADRGHRYLYSPRPYRNGPPCHWRVGQPRRQRWYHQSSGCFTSRFLSASVGFPIIIIPVRPPPAVFVAEFLRSSLSLSLRRRRSRRRSSDPAEQTGDSPISSVRR